MTEDGKPSDHLNPADWMLLVFAVSCGVLGVGIKLFGWFS